MYDNVKMEQAKNLRTFHNDIKLIMISKYTAYLNCANVSLLDVGVGRGGDIHKWNKCNVSYAVGIDINKDYVHEAIKRYKGNNKFLDRNYIFYYTHPDQIFQKFLESRIKTSKKSFNIITCMFAFHYFCENEARMRDILRQVSESLSEGEYFIGVVPQGEKITKLMRDKDEYTSNAMHIEKVNKNCINFMLSGTLYFGEKMLSKEYLVNEETFVKIAKEYSLEVVEYTNFEKYYVSKYNMDNATREASFVNGTFAFIKKKK